MRLSSTYYKTITVSDPLTGVLTTPNPIAATIYKNGVADDITLTVTAVSTGIYKIYASGATPAFEDNGFAEGDKVDCLVTATVSGTSYTSVVDSFNIDVNVLQYSESGSAVSSGASGSNIHIEFSALVYPKLRIIRREDGLIWDDANNALSASPVYANTVITLTRDTVINGIVVELPTALPIGEYYAVLYDVNSPSNNDTAVKVVELVQTTKSIFGF